MSRRFYCSNLAGNQLVLDEAETHHAIHVLRLSVGDGVELFDGNGRTCSGTISAVSRRTVEITPDVVVAHQPPNHPSVTVACAVPKGDRMRTLVEKLTEIGVDRLIPLVTERSVTDPRKSKLEKLNQTVISAARQSGRNWLLEISSPQKLSDVLSQIADSGDQAWIAHPGDTHDPLLIQPRNEQQTDQNLTLLIGPEGGFSDVEVQQARDAGAVCLSWPGSILRVETAAIVFSTLFLSGRSSASC